jgi:pimeloyl-ACP methyl ester carboxylesterase
LTIVCRLGHNAGAVSELPPTLNGTPVSATERIERALVSRMRAKSALGAGGCATIVLDTGADAWTLSFDAEGASLSTRRTPSPDAVLFAAPDVMAGVVEGNVSGVDAWLAGELTMRGNIALALKLQGTVHPDRPARIPRARTVSAHGVDTFYLEAGYGPAVVLLHGLGATNSSMLPTLAELSHDHRVLAPDLPGFGESAKPLRAYHPAFYARWLHALLDATHVERALLVGNSMGGRVAIEMALRHPARVERLVLFAPSLAFRRFRFLQPVVRLLAAELGVVPVPVPRWLAMRVLRLMFAEPERLPAAWYEAAMDEFQRVFSTLRGRIAFFSAARQLYLEASDGPHGFWERLPALACPALFLWGDQDLLVPAAFAPHVEAALPGARSVVLPSCGHVPQFEHPALTHRLVREFLSELPTRPG